MDSQELPKILVKNALLPACRQTRPSGRGRQACLSTDRYPKINRGFCKDRGDKYIQAML